MQPNQFSQETRRICGLAPVIPVLTIEKLKDAVPLAEALVGGGLPVLEVTLRTSCALEAITAMQKVKGAIVGAGTLLTAKDVQAAKSAGARFGVSPGATDRLLDRAETEKLPLLPGAATASEAMGLLERRYDMLKFFPAESSGGTKALKSIGAPLPMLSFCPTGGVGPENAGAYLSLQNVLCVGGSWVAPGDLVAKGAWDDIRSLARSASNLKAVA